MVLTAGQRTTFFTNEAQLGIPAETLVQMAQDGITSEKDLVVFDVILQFSPLHLKDTINDIWAVLTWFILIKGFLYFGPLGIGTECQE